MSVPSWVRPGAKCVCVSTAGRIVDGFTEGTSPQAGCVYTVEGYEEEDGETYLWLVEFPDGATNIRNLRPLVPKSLEQDSTMFRKLLQPKRVRGSVDA